MKGFVKEHNLEMDRDGDERVSAAEMAGQFRKFFEREDGNGDGKLTVEEYAVEGGCMAHLFEGKEGAVQRPREELVFHFPHYQGDSPHSAILLGDYKMMKFYESGETQLFELADDIGEGNDLAGKMPEKAKELEEKLIAYLEAVGAGLPVPNPEYVEGTTYEK